MIYRAGRAALEANAESGLLAHGFVRLTFRQLATGLRVELPPRLAAATGVLAIVAGLLAIAHRALGATVPVPARVSAWLRGGAAAGLASVVAVGAAAPLLGALQEPPRWNVVVVVVDTLRADHLGLYGYDRGTSPRLDAFAEDAFVFERALSNAPWTRPAVAAILASQTPFESGLYSEDRREKLDPRTPTLQKMLRNRGYRAGAFLTNPHYRQGLDRDFDTVWWSGLNAKRVFPEALRWLDTGGGERFFLLVHNIDPHDTYLHRSGFSTRPSSSTLRSTRPFLPAQQDGSGISFDSPDNVVTPLDDERLAELRDNYDGEIRAWDHAFGEFLDALGARGLLEETVVVVVADHGEEFLDHGSYWHGGTLHRELLHVPLILRVPGEGAGRFDDWVSLVDVLPTVAELVGVPIPETARGRSLVPLLHGGAIEPRPILAATGFRLRQIQYGVVHEGFKWIRDEAGRSHGLFDLSADPLERVDRSGEDALRARLEALLPEPRPPASRTAAPPAPKLDPATRESLRALGYVAESPDDPGETPAPEQGGS